MENRNECFSQVLRETMLFTDQASLNLLDELLAASLKKEKSNKESSEKNILVAAF